MTLVVKNPPANSGDARDVVSIPDGGRSPGEGNGNPLQYSCLENPMDRGDWWAIVHGISKSQTWLRCLNIALKGKESVWGEMEARKSLVWLENTHCLVALGPAANDRNCIEQGGCCQVGGCLEVFAKFGYCSIEKRVFLISVHDTVQLPITGVWTFGIIFAPYFSSQCSINLQTLLICPS